MKTKLLKKVRKRFSYKLVELSEITGLTDVRGEPFTYGPEIGIELIDHKLKCVDYLPKKVLFKFIMNALGHSMDLYYQERRREYRINLRKYNRAIKNEDKTLKEDPGQV